MVCVRINKGQLLGENISLTEIFIPGKIKFV